MDGWHVNSLDGQAKHVVGLANGEKAVIIRLRLKPLSSCAPVRNRPGAICARKMYPEISGWRNVIWRSNKRFQMHWRLPWPATRDHLRERPEDEHQG
ncbi:hypothetical protein VTK56DRAFT_2936 [Thermocarpiscus australiensis]